MKNEYKVIVGKAKNAIYLISEMLAILVKSVYNLEKNSTFISNIKKKNSFPIKKENKIKRFNKRANTKIIACIFIIIFI